MNPAENYSVVLVTAPDLATARKLAQCALEARAAACANLSPNLESHYWWQGKIESSPEVLMIFKTTRERLAALEGIILANHPYDTPEIIALPLHAGTPKYLAWLARSVQRDAGGQKPADFGG
jgi:periplasmic divalent cation tolerance protein